jgi:hypothetical protein
MNNKKKKTKNKNKTKNTTKQTNNKRFTFDMRYINLVSNVLFIFV